MKRRIRLLSLASAVVLTCGGAYAADNYYFRFRPSIQILNQDPFSVWINGDQQGTVGATFSAKAETSTAKDSLRFHISAGHLPPGIGLNSTSGDISGNPTATGRFTSTITAEDGLSTASAPFSVTIFDTLAIDGTIPRYATVGVPFSASFASSGGDGNYEWTLTGSLPDGLIFNEGSQSSVISGVPTAAGQWNGLRVNVSDGSGHSTSSSAFSINVADALALAGSAPTFGTVNEPYSATFSTIGGHAPLRWSISSGSLPTGLTLSNGLISGTPTRAENASGLVIHVSDDAGNSASSDPFSIAITDRLLVSGNLPGNAGIGDSYSATLTATGGRAPYTWSKTSGELPDGLSMSNGVVSGSPTREGTWENIVFQVADADGRTTSTSAASITVSSPVVPNTYSFTGSGSFTIPAYNSIQIEVYGQGGYGSGIDTKISIPSYGDIIAYAGRNPDGSTNSMGAALGGAGGGASGGDINLTGEKGDDQNGGMPSPCISAGGASGGVAYGGGGRTTAPYTSGNSPGGGAGGPVQSMYRPPTGMWFMCFPAGGGGGYARKTFTKGQTGAPAVGSVAPYTVGAASPPPAGSVIGGVGLLKITIN